MRDFEQETLNVVDRVLGLGFTCSFKSRNELREWLLGIACNWLRPMEAFTALKKMEVLIEFDLEGRLDWESAGAFAGMIDQLAKLAQGEVEITDATDDLWMDRSRKTFRVAFRVNGQIHSVDFPQDPELDFSEIYISLIHALNDALAGAGTTKRFCSVADKRFEASGQVFASPESVRALEEEDLVGNFLNKKK